MTRKLTFLRECEVCLKTYRRKHSCSGKGHRRVEVPPPSTVSRSGRTRNRTCRSGKELSLNNAVGFPIEKSGQFLSQEVRLTTLSDLQSFCKELPMDLKKFLLNSFAQKGVFIPSPADVVRSLLAASNIGSWGLSNRERIVGLAERLVIDHPLFQLQAEITHRRSVLMRLKGDIEGSEGAIKTFLSSLNYVSNDLALEDRAALHLSQATNHAYRFSFAEAHEEVKKWMPVQILPGKEEHLLWDQMLCVGRLMRGQGCFTDAKICFQTCLGVPGLRGSKRFLVKSALADLYCELDYLETGERTLSYLSRAKAMVEPEIERLRASSSQNLKGFRRLLLSVVEIDIRQGYRHEPDLGIRELLAIYSNLREPDIVDRLGHVRTLIAFARISPTLEDALERWTDVLSWNRFFNPLEGDVFTCGVVYLFLCETWYSLGDIDKSMKAFRKAMEVVQRNPRQFLIPGIGTYLYDGVRDRVQSTTGWLLKTP